MFNWFNRSILDYIEYHLVDHCNLNCSGCTHFSPLAAPRFANLEQFKKDFSQLKKLFYVRKIRLMGGEPLLHPRLKEFLIAIREIFPKTEVEVVTNGIFLGQDAELIKVINDNNIIVDVTDYGILDVKKAIAGIKRVITCSRNEMYNISFDMMGQQDPDYSFHHCISAKCHYFKDGYLYQCATAVHVAAFNKYFDKHLPIASGMSIYEHTAEELLKFLTIPCELCKYCNLHKSPTTYHPFCRSERNIKEWTY